MSEYPRELYGGMPPHAPTDTSFDAAAAIADHAETIRDRVYEYIVKQRGATNDEIEVALELRTPTTTARCRELVLLGLVQDSGKRRETRCGRQAIVWEVAA